MTCYGHYGVEAIRLVWRMTTPTMTLPVSSADGGLADANYRYVGRCVPENGHHRYELIGVHEWCPPLHPTLRNRADRQMSVRADGTQDMEAEATLRRREWADMRMLEDGPIYEDDNAV